MYKKIHVYDIDGVLVDSSHRYRNLPNGSIDLQYWIDNCHKRDQDTLLPLSIDYRIDRADPDIYTVLATARVYHPADVQFIARKLGMPNKLIMRPVGNNDPDSKLKKRELSRLFNLKQFRDLPRKLFEDNPLTIEALSSIFTESALIASKIWGR